MMLTWLPEVLRAAGLVVVEYPGWQTRTTRASGLTSIEGVVCHHTATGKSWSNEAVANLLAEGRADLEGPLSPLGLDRDGHYWMIAAGRCNHNGYGTYGNDSIGIEAFNDGKGEQYPDVQYDAFARGCAAIANHLGLTIAQVRGHKETDPQRKIDPLFDMSKFRTKVAAYQEDDMPTAKEVALEVVRLLDEPVPTGQVNFRRTVYDMGKRILDPKYFEKIAKAVVAELPESSGGGISQADVEAAVVKVLKSVNV